MPMTIDNHAQYAQVIISNAAVEFARSRRMDPGAAIDAAREQHRQAVELAAAQDVRYFTPTAEDIRCLRMALKYNIF